MDTPRFLKGKWARRGAWLGGFYLFYALVSWRAAPWIVPKICAAVPGSLPGFDASVRETVYNPFSLRLTLRGLSFGQKTLGEIASCGELSVALNPASLLRLAAGLREIKLVDPKLTIVIAADGTSVLDAMPKSAEEPAKKAGPTFIPRVVIGALEVSGGALDFESRLPNAPQKLSAHPIAFRLENLSTIPDDGGKYSLQAVTSRRERLLWNGELTVRPARLSGRVALENADLSRESTGVPSAPVSFDAGRLDASADYAVTLDSGSLTLMLKNVRGQVSELLWRLKGSPEKEPRGPFDLHVGPGSLSVNAYALGAPEGKVALRADLPVEKTGDVRVRAYVTPKPLAGGAELEVDAVPLPPFSPLAPPPTRASLDAGRASLRAKAAYAAGGIDGEVSLSVEDFRLSDRASGKTLVGCGRFAVESAKLSTKKRAVEVAAIRVEKPLLRLSRGKDGKTNVEAAAGISFSSAPAQAQAAAESKPAAAGPMWKAKLKRFSLTGGRVLVADDAVAPPFALDINSARAEVIGLSDDARSTATISAAAKIEQAPVGLDATVRLSTTAAWGVARIKGQGIQLPLFSSYSGKYAGYKIDKGSFGFDLDHKIDGRSIATLNHAIIDQMTFGEKVESPDATKAPVKLGLAILKDRNGVIDLNVPIDGSLDDPNFHIAGVIIKTLANLVVKAALSPFSALSAMMGSKDDMGKVAFAPAGAQLTDALSAQLDKVAKVLSDKPEMLIGVRGAATKADSLAAGDLVLLKKLRGKEPGTDPLTPKEETKVLNLRKSLLGAEAASPAAARADLDAKWRGGDAEMRQLALARAGAVKEALAAKGVSPERFFSLEPVAGANAPDETTSLQLDVR